MLINTHHFEMWSDVEVNIVIAIFSIYNKKPRQEKVETV